LWLENVEKWSFRGAKPLFPNNSPSPLKERGTQGVRLIIKNATDRKEKR
jgi:hypothetical protein